MRWEAAFAQRFPKLRPVEPHILVLAPVAAAFCLLRYLGLIADEPYWLLVGLVIGCGLLSVLAAQYWCDAGQSWHLPVYVSVNVGLAAVVMYATGWGPVLAVGFVFVSASALQPFGSKATVWSVIATIAALMAGQGAIALGWAPTLIHRPLVQGVAVLSLMGSLLVILLLGRVTAAREKAEALIRQSERRFRALVSNATDIIMVVDNVGGLQYASPAIERVLEWPTGSFLHRPPTDFVHPDDLSDLARQFAGLPAHADRVIAARLRLRHAGGEWRRFDGTITDRRDDPDVQGIVGNLHDVGELLDVQEHLAHAAVYDPMTGLPNRTLFGDRLTVALENTRRRGGRVAVGFLDLDRFKLVNDGLGHAAGDELLQSVATRLREALRDGDTVARFGGDEFTVLWDDLADEESVLAAASQMLDALQRPFELDGVPVFVSASMGVTFCTQGATSPESMLQEADSAMYLAKEAGRGRVEVFDGKSHEVALQRLNIINELHRALADDELRLHYQPIVDLATDEVVAVEALVRWQHPTRGLVAPGDFVPLAEESGLIVPLGTWVLREASRQTALWNERGRANGLDPLQVHVNISTRQLGDTEFVASVEDALSDSGLAPGALCIEITETSLMGDEDTVTETLLALRTLGAGVSIDDFGTGYSSLAYLKRFAIDSLKVDQAFVKDLGEGPDDPVIARAIIGLAHALGVIAVAEGVETEEALRGLRGLDCDRAQGFLLARPQPPEALDALLCEPVLSAPAPGAGRADRNGPGHPARRLVRPVGLHANGTRPVPSASPAATAPLPI